jgi:mono/diheme cytochrome c family protein
MSRIRAIAGLFLVLTLFLAACGDTPTATTAPTTLAATTAASTTVAATTVAATTAAPTTAAATTAVATTVAPTTAVATTAATTTTRAATTVTATTTVAATTAAPTTVAATTAAGGNDTARGLAIFKSQNCASCHGGDTAVGGLGPALNNLSYPFENFLRQVRSGAGVMPPYPATALPDADVRLIYAYLQSIKK